MYTSGKNWRPKCGSEKKRGERNSLSLAGSPFEGEEEEVISEISPSRETILGDYERVPIGGCSSNSEAFYVY